MLERFVVMYLLVRDLQEKTKSAEGIKSDQQQRAQRLSQILAPALVRDSLEAAPAILAWLL